jgi:mercuric ion transport protein
MRSGNVLSDLFQISVCWRACDWLAIMPFARTNCMEQTSKRPLSGILAAASILTGAGAIFAASCCVLPLVMGGLGAGAGLFWVLEVLADYRIATLVLSAALLVVTWAVYFRRRGARSTALALAIATVFVGTAAGWDHFEPPYSK